MDLSSTRVQANDRSFRVLGKGTKNNVPALCISNEVTNSKAFVISHMSRHKKQPRPKLSHVLRVVIKWVLEYMMGVSHHCMHTFSACDLPFHLPTWVVRAHNYPRIISCFFSCDFPLFYCETQQKEHLGLDKLFLHVLVRFKELRPSSLQYMTLYNLASINPPPST